MVFVYIGEIMIRMKLDVETLRVIYFTYSHTEPLHFSPHTLDYEYMDDLPTGMTLDNCWNWTLRGDKLIKTETNNIANKSLLENNKIELKKLLIKRINDIRTLYLSEFLGDDYLKKLKLDLIKEENNHFIAELAKAANMSTQAYKTIFLNKIGEQDKILQSTEINKEYYLRLINEAETDQQLFSIREEFDSKNLSEIQLK